MRFAAASVPKQATQCLGFWLPLLVDGPAAGFLKKWHHFLTGWTIAGDE